MPAKAETAVPQAAASETASTSAPIDQDTLDVKALARAVLDRSIRPRAASIRRLAEAVLAGDGKKAKKKGKAKDAASTGKGRKLARIPGQKDGNKKKDRA